MTDTPSLPPLLLTSRDAAKVLAISERSLWQLTHDGRLPCVKIGSRGIRYSVQALQDFANGQTPQPRSEEVRP